MILRDEQALEDAIDDTWRWAMQFDLVNHAPFAIPARRDVI